MAARTVEVPLADGGTILVEVEESVGPAGDAPVVRGRAAFGELPRITEPLEHVLDGLGPATSAVFSQLTGLAHAPDEIEVEFAVKLSADARVIIARAGGEANFRIAMRWTRDRADAPPSAR